MTVPSALTAPQLQFVWEAVHDRYARQAADVPVHAITFTKLTRPQRDALAGLLGRSRLPGPTGVRQAASACSRYSAGLGPVSMPSRIARLLRAAKRATFIGVS